MKGKDKIENARRGAEALYTLAKEKTYQVAKDAEERRNQFVSEWKISAWRSRAIVLGGIIKEDCKDAGRWCYTMIVKRVRDFHDR